MPNKQQARGRTKKIAGKAEEMAGRATGDRRMEGRGRDRQAEGAVEKTAGDVKDKVKSVAGKLRGR